MGKAHRAWMHENPEAMEYLFFRGKHDWGYQFTTKKDVDVIIRIQANEVIIHYFGNKYAGLREMYATEFIEYLKTKPYEPGSEFDGELNFDGKEEEIINSYLNYKKERDGEKL